MTHQCFDITLDKHVAHLRLNRPQKRNSLVPAFWDDLPEAIREIDAAADARAIVISSEGPHFCSGLDLEMFGNNAVPSDKQGKAHAQKQRGAAFMDVVARMQDTFSALEDCRLPVLAAVQGGCIGGGVDFVTACDIRLAEPKTYFTIWEIKVGMTADVGTFPRIVKLLPEGIVRELAYTGRRMDAQEAERLGFVNRIHDTPDALLDGALALAQDIAANAPLAIYGCKKAITYARDHTTQEGLDWIGMWNASMLSTQEIQEAIGAQAEKRAGDFAPLPKRKLGG